jgi:hypothetical protein
VIVNKSRFDISQWRIYKNIFLGVVLTIGSVMNLVVAEEWLDESDQSWMLVNDDVMGGRSTSNAFWVDGERVIRFQGDLSLQNNGGFASLRGAVKPGYFSKAKNICIEVKGDGRQYQFRLRNSYRFGSYAYVAEFETQKNTWQKLCFDAASFTAQFRGRTLNNIGPPDFDDIRQIGFLIADKIEQRFKLDIRSISTAE